MNRVALLLFGGGLVLLAAIALVPGASAAWTTSMGCSDIILSTPTGGLQVHAYLASDASCANHGDAAAGTCQTYALTYVTTGTGGPSTPTGTNVYLFENGLSVDHGPGGNVWTNPVRTEALGPGTSAKTFQACGTSDGTSTGAGHSGLLRMVIRMCAYVGATGDGCAGTAPTYDVNTDAGSAGGTKGASTLTTQTQGIQRYGAHVTTITDSTTMSGADVSTYVWNEKPAVKVVATETAFSGMGTAATLDFKITTAAFADICGTASGYTTATTGSLQAAATVSAQTATAITYNDCFSTGTTYGLQIVPTPNTGYAGITWTSFWTLPPTWTGAQGMTALGPWGSVDKTLTTACTLRDPVSGATALTPARLEPGEQAQCRSTNLQNARGEATPAGSFASVYVRRAAMASQDQTDATKCDVTTTSAGVYICDVTIKDTATLTTGLLYGVDVAIYQDSGRSILLTRAYVPALFDVSSTRSYASATGTLDCGSGAVSPQSVYHLGQSVTLTFRLCNARDQAITPTLNAQILRSDTNAVDNSNGALVAASGTYSWTHTTTGGSAHTDPGLAKRLTITDSHNIALTKDPVYAVSSLLHFTITTYANACSPPATQVFVIGADLVAQQEGPVTDANGDAQTQTLTWTHTYTNTGGSGATLPSDSATSAGPMSACHQVVPQPPQGSAWLFQSHVSDASGNSGDASIGETFVSPYTSPVGTQAVGHSVATPPGGTFHVLIQIQKRDPVTLIMQPQTPDGVPSFRVNSTDGNGHQTAIVVTSATAPVADAPSNFYANWTVPTGWNLTAPATMQIEYNVSGAAFHDEYTLNIQAPGGGTDPIHATAAYSWDDHRATVILTETWSNGTLRTGAPPSVSIYGTDDSNLSFQPTATEISPGVYVARVYMGISPTRGNYFAVGSVAQPDGSVATTSAVFTIADNETLQFLDARGFQQAMWAGFNASISDLRTHLDTNGALINQTREAIEGSAANVSAFRSETQANFDHTDALIESIIANAATLGPRALNLTWASDHAPWTSWIGKATRLQANSTTTSSYNGFAWTWDLGDETTAQGAIVYHKYTKTGDYNVEARLVDAFGGVNVTNVTIRVTNPKPIMNITGPTEVFQTEAATFTIGTSVVPHGEAVYFFASDEVTTDIWPFGTRHANSGYCGPANATTSSLAAAWLYFDSVSCKTWTTHFARVGNHTVTLHAYTPQGVTETITLNVHVTQIPAKEALKNVDHGADTVAQNVNDAGRKAGSFLRWIAGFFGA